MTKTAALLAAAGFVFAANAQPLIATDDDDGFGLLSTLSFGTGSGNALGDTFNLGGDGIANGEDGALAAGSYFLAIGSFNTNFDAAIDLGDVTSGASGGSYQIDLYSESGIQTITGTLAGGAVDVYTVSFSGAFFDINVSSADFDSEIGLFAIPTPGAAAVLGLGGLVATRRRR